MTVPIPAARASVSLHPGCSHEAQHGCEHIPAHRQTGQPSPGLRHRLPRYRLYVHAFPNPVLPNHGDVQPQLLVDLKGTRVSAGFACCVLDVPFAFCLRHVLEPITSYLQLRLLCWLRAVLGGYIIKEQRLLPLAAQGEKC